MQSKDLKAASTRELVEELKNRHGVNSIIVTPSERYKITVGESVTEEIGPAILLVVID